MGQVLLLNADAKPVSYLPLSSIQWKEAVMYMYHDKCTVLDWYDDWIVRSPSWETRVPAVIMLKDFMKRRRNPRFSKNNLYLRDQYTCKYCNTRFPKKELTIDHVQPISKGGKTTWENCVCACNPCNSRKVNKLNINPLETPHRPGYYELVRKRKLMDLQLKHPSWEKWLS